MAELNSDGHHSALRKGVLPEGRQSCASLAWLPQSFEGSGNEGVAFVLDLSEQKLAEDALLQAQAELARVSRMTTMEQLTSSIAHEVNQPLGAVVTSGNACLNWLSTSSSQSAQSARGRRTRCARW